MGRRRRRGGIRWWVGERRDFGEVIEGDVKERFLMIDGVVTSAERSRQ